MNHLPHRIDHTSHARWWIGVDGGGTGTALQLQDAQGRVQGRVETGPAALAQGIELAWSHIQQGVAALLAQAGVTTWSWSEVALGLGLSGVTVASRAEAFLAQAPVCARLRLDSDGFAAVLGAHGGQAGAVLTAGTGTVGEALRRDGSRAIVSGWGWISGDEGSGAWLGLQALRHAQRVSDGRSRATPLSDRVMAVTGSARGDLLGWSAQNAQRGHAGLAPLVFDCADADPHAEGLLVRAAEELMGVCEALDPQRGLPLALNGSIAQRLAPRFSEAWRARIVSAQGDATDGALHLLRAP